MTATDSFGNAAAATSIAVTVNALPVIAAPATVAVGATATAIPGLAVSEAGTTTGESFTVTLADPNGVVSASGTGVSGSGTTKLTVAGTLAQVNAALGTVTDTDAAGTADTLTVNAADSFGNNAAPVSVAITALGRTYTLTTAPTTITGTAGNDTIIASNATLISRDHIDAGAGTNTLQLSGGGSFDLGAPAQLANIGVVTAAEGQAAGGGIPGQHADGLPARWAEPDGQCHVGGRRTRRTRTRKASRSTARPPATSSISALAPTRWSLAVRTSR